MATRLLLLAVAAFFLWMAADRDFRGAGIGIGAVSLLAAVFV